MKKLNDLAFKAVRDEFRGKVFAFAAVTSPLGHFQLGVAVANEYGYTPVPSNESYADGHEEMSRHADELNEKLGLNEKSAGWIVASSMVNWPKVKK